MVITGAVFKDIADAIREKEGSTETMKISQMAERIRNIPQGGGGERLVNADRDVIFFGCDGAVLYAYDREEFLEINELPPLPEYDGLVAQCWNMTLEELQNQLDNCAGAEVGALYTTADNASWIVLNVPEQYTTIGFRFNVSKEITINFGDGTGIVTLSSSTTDTYYHTFPHGGRYTVKVWANEENSWNFVYDQVESYAGFVRNSDDSSDTLNKTFKAFVERVHLTYGAKFNGAAYLYNLCIFTTSQEVVFPDVGLSFRGDYNLKCVTIPSTYTHTLNSYAFQNTFCLRFVSFGAESNPHCGYMFNYSGIERLSTNYIAGEPPTLSSPAQYMRYAEARRVNIYHGSKVSASYLLGNMAQLQFVDMSAWKSIPSINSSCFQAIKTFTKIIVPDELYGDWIVATNWSTNASKIVKKSESILHGGYQ